MVILSSICALADAAGAEPPLILNSGECIFGRCEGVAESEVLWRSKYGGLAHVAVSSVKSVTTEVECDLSLSDGERVRGRWKVEDGVLLVNSPVLGSMHYPVSLLTAAVPAVSGRGLNGAAESPASSPAQPSGSTPTGGPTTSTDATETPSTPVGKANEPPPTSLQSLLRASSILLRPGEWNVATTLQYEHDHTLYAEDDLRGLGADFRLQRGLSPRFEADLDWPGIFTRTTSLVVPTTNEGSVTQTHSTQLRSGNPEIALSSLLWEEGAIRPEAVLTSGLTIPINAARNGGLFRSRFGLELLKTSDPGAVFAGVGWIHEFNGWTGSPFRLRDHVTYNFGTALGVSDELAVGVAVQGEYIPNLVNRKGELVEVSVEPVTGKFWINFRLSYHAFVELAVLPSLNDDAHDTSFQLTYIRHF